MAISKKVRLALLAACGVMAVCSAGLAAEWHVKTTGTPGGNGSDASPWDLKTALSGTAVVHGGDTVWLHGGRYTHQAGYDLQTKLVGAPGHPITIKPWTGDKVTIDGDASLTVDGAYIDFWDLEITNTVNTTNRKISATGSNPRGRRPNGFDVFGHHVRLINLVLHDAGVGFGMWSDDAVNKGAEDAAINCITYYNGWVAPDRPHGHGFYVQNKQPGHKYLTDNIVFSNMNLGIQCYTEAGNIDNFVFDGNISFNNGNLAGQGRGDTNFYIGGKQSVNNVVTNNCTFSDAGSAIYTGPSSNITIKDNYFCAGKITLWPGDKTVTGNVFVGVADKDDGVYPGNTYIATRPAQNKVFIRPHTLVPGRGNIMIYNWENQSAVDVDVSSILKAGASYELLDGVNYLGKPLLTGTYAGEKLHIPMTGLTMPKPIGNVPWTPPHPGPTIGVFILRTIEPARAAQ
jgi:hypothetical protein